MVRRVLSAFKSFYKLALDKDIGTLGVVNLFILSLMFFVICLNLLEDALFTIHSILISWAATFAGKALVRGPAEPIEQWLLFMILGSVGIACLLLIGAFRAKKL